MPRIKKAGTNKKNPLPSSQAATERVQKLRREYWEKVKNIHPENLVFIDEMGVLLIDYKLGLLASWYQSIRDKTILRPAQKSQQLELLVLKKWWVEDDE